MELTALKSQLVNWYANFKESIQPFLEEKKIIPRQRSFYDDLKTAHQEWEEAQNYFNNVSDPELVDHASYLLQAAEKKYMYLLKKADDFKQGD